MWRLTKQVVFLALSLFIFNTANSQTMENLYAESKYAEIIELSLKYSLEESVLGDSAFNLMGIQYKKAVLSEQYPGYGNTL